MRSARPLPSKISPAVILLIVLAASLFVACGGLYFMGLSWKSEAARLSQKLDRQSDLLPALATAQRHLLLLQRLAHEPDPPAEEIRAIASDAVETLLAKLGRPEDPEGAHLLVGQIREFQHDFDGALLAYSRAVDQAPKRSSALYERGMLRLKHLKRKTLIRSKEECKDLADAAASDLRTFASQWPSWELRLTATAALAYLIADAAKTSEAIEFAQKFDDRTWVLPWLQALSFFDENRLGESLIAVRGARERFPYSCEAAALEGQIHLTLGKPEFALEVLRTCVTLDPEFAEAHVLLGDALQGLGKNEEAQKAWQEALRFDPALDKRLGDRLDPPPR